MGSYFKKQIIEAHRGASGYYRENTFEAFDYAVELKCDAIELDVRKTKDNQYIICHNSTYKNKAISSYDYKELCEITKNDNFVMPLLIDVLTRYKGKIILDIELKESGYEKEIVDLILSVLSPSEFFVRSFKYNSIKKIKELNRNIFTILLLENEKRLFIRLLKQCNKSYIKKSLCDCVSPSYLLINKKFIKKMRSINKDILVWTINETDMMDTMLNKFCVDGIITNYPDKAIEIRDNSCK